MTDTKVCHKYIYYPLEHKGLLHSSCTQTRSNLKRRPHCFRKQAHGEAVSWVAGTGPSACLTGWQSQDPGLRKT